MRVSVSSCIRTKYSSALSLSLPSVGMERRVYESVCDMHGMYGGVYKSCHPVCIDNEWSSQGC